MRNDDGIVVLSQDDTCIPWSFDVEYPKMNDNKSINLPTSRTEFSPWSGGNQAKHHELSSGPWSLHVCLFFSSVREGRRTPLPRVATPCCPRSRYNF